MRPYPPLVRAMFTLSSPVSGGMPQGPVGERVPSLHVRVPAMPLVMHLEIRMYVRPLRNRV